MLPVNYRYSQFEAKRGWKLITWRDSKIANMYADVVMKAVEFGWLTTHNIPKLYWNHNIKRAIGRCSWRGNGNGACVQLAPYLERATNDKAVMNIICHEVGHACSVGHHHDSYWKQRAQRLADAFDCGVITQYETNKDILNLKHASQSDYKYVRYCPHCRVITKKFKTNCDGIKYAHNWTHNACGHSVVGCAIADLPADIKIK
jgi:hypothetical protein